MLHRLADSFSTSSATLEGPDSPRSCHAGRIGRTAVHALADRPPTIADPSPLRPRAALRRVASAPEVHAAPVETGWPCEDHDLGASPAWSHASFGSATGSEARSTASCSRASTSCEDSGDELDERSRLAPIPDLAAISSRAQAANTRLLACADAVLRSLRRVPFSQSDLLEVLVPADAPEAAGICMGLSMEWLATCHAHPTQSAHACTQRVGKGEQAHDALAMHRAYLDAFESTPSLRRPVNRAFSERDIGIGKYRQFTCHPRIEPVIDVAERVSQHMSRHGPHHLLTFNTEAASHTIACIEQAGGTFCVFDPNHGSFEVAREALAELLASVFVSFARSPTHAEATPADPDLGEAGHDLRAVYVSPVRFKAPPCAS